MTKAIIILLMSAFFAKSQYFLAKIVPLLKVIVWKQFVLFSDFVRKKVTVNENVSFTDYASGIRLPDCFKLAINWKKWQWHSNWSTWHHHQLFCHWSKFYINIIIGSGVMIIYFYKGLTRIRKSETPQSEFCPISGDWEFLRIQNLAQMSLMKCY